MQKDSLMVLQAALRTFKKKRDISSLTPGEKKILPNNYIYLTKPSTIIIPSHKTVTSSITQAINKVKRALLVY